MQAAPEREEERRGEKKRESVSDMRLKLGRSDGLVVRASGASSSGSGSGRGGVPKRTGGNTSNRGGLWTPNQAAPSVEGTPQLILPQGLYCETIYKTQRRPTSTVWVGPVPIGSEHPIARQTMTTTDTKNVDATVEQVSCLTTNSISTSIPFALFFFFGNIFLKVVFTLTFCLLFCV